MPLQKANAAALQGGQAVAAELDGWMASMALRQLKNRSFSARCWTCEQA